MIKRPWLTACYLMSYFLIHFQIILWRTYSATIWFVKGTGMLVAFSSSFYNLKTHFLPSYAMLILSFALLLVLLAEKCIYFYNLSEMSFTFVLLCFMADKHVSTCDNDTTLFSVEINDPNLCLSLSSISNASYSKEELHFVQAFLSSGWHPTVLLSLDVEVLSTSDYVYLGTRKGGRNSNLNSAGSVSWGIWHLM